VFARGLRNAAGIAVNPASGILWATVNERDNLGDSEPDDFFTGVSDGGFYGWPFAYGNGVIDARVRQRPEPVARMTRPDSVLGAHVAPLQFAFYTGMAFPSNYINGAFIALHGSWNRREPSGYEVAFVPFRGGLPAGKSQTFLDGFMTDRSRPPEVLGRPAGVTITDDGALLVSDDGANVIWHVVFGDAVRAPNSPRH